MNPMEADTLKCNPRISKAKMPPLSAKGRFRRISIEWRMFPNVVKRRTKMMKIESGMTTNNRLVALS
jgi:hypothetical protein